MTEIIVACFIMAAALLFAAPAAGVSDKIARIVDR